MAVIQSLLQNNQDYFDTYIEFATLIFKKSDISPFTFQITFKSSDEKRSSIGRYEKELKDKYKDINNSDINLMGRILSDSLLINERRNLRWSELKSTKFIFDNDPNTLVSISENVYSKPIEFDPQHELIKKIKSSSTVTVLIERENYQPTYLKIDLTGSSRVISQVLKDMTPSDKNIFEYRYNMGLANMNPFDYEGYIYKFLEDSKKNHDLNLDYIRNTKIFTISKNLEAGTIAESFSMNDDSSVILQIDPSQWRNASQVKRWYIIYHELGHDILNLEHGQCGRMMDAYAKDDYTWNEFEEDKKIMFEKYKELH